MALTKADFLGISKLINSSEKRMNKKFDKMDLKFEKRFEKIEQERRIRSKQFAIKRLQERQEDRDFMINQLKKLKAKFI